MRKHILTAFTALALSCIGADVLADSKHGHRDRHHEPRHHYQKHYQRHYYPAPRYQAYHHDDYHHYDRHHYKHAYCQHGHHGGHAHYHEEVAFGVVGYDYGLSIRVRR